MGTMDSYECFGQSLTPHPSGQSYKHYDRKLLVLGNQRHWYSLCESRVIIYDRRAVIRLTPAIFIIGNGLGHRPMVKIVFGFVFAEIFEI